MRNRIWCGVLLVTATWLGLGVFPQRAEAIPSFAKKHDMACSGCHSPFPLLNEFGRAYKQNGYRIGTVTETTPRRIADDLILNNEFPITVRVVGRPYDKTTQDPTWKLDALHEAELMVAGNPHPEMSAWLALAAEDEADWTASLEEGVVGMHLHPLLNIQAGYANIFFSDPYDTLANTARRMTVSRKNALDFTVGSNTRRLWEPVQQVNINGRISRLYYLAAVATNNGGTEGNERDKDVLGRLAINVIRDTIVGGFYYAGSDLLGPVAAPFDDRFRRLGIDLRHDCRLTGASILAMNLWSRDENPDGTGNAVDLMAGYVEVLRPFEVGGRTIVPLARYNWSGSDDDQALAESLRAYTLHVGYYPYANVRAFAEYTAEQSGQSNNNDNRLTMQFDVAF